jgi:hypothetical protein
MIPQEEAAQKVSMGHLDNWFLLLVVQAADS